MPIISEQAGWTEDDVATHVLDGEPPGGFDCGREMQNAFLYQWAWADQQVGVSVTHLYFVKGIFAGYATVVMDALVLGKPERGRGVRYSSVGAMKLAQLGVDRTFAGHGLGSLVIADVIRLARELSGRVGCRYLTLDAQPDLVAWYADRLGFLRNDTTQERREKDALAHRRPIESLAVSMRFDLRDVDD
jgi:GNAT superfamily N-acetyltransferase